MNSPQQVNRVPATFSCGVVAVCKVLSATFIVAQGGDCISLRYDIAVRSPTNSSELTAGFNASSCDAFDGNCCNGLLIPASSVTSNNVTLPCWILNKNNGFVNIVAQPHCPTASKTVTDEATDEATTTTSVSPTTVDSVTLTGSQSRSLTPLVASTSTVSVTVLYTAAFSKSKSSSEADTTSKAVTFSTSETRSETVTTSKAATTTVTTSAALCFVPTMCKLLSSSFFVIKDNFCFSLRYDVAVQSLTNASEWITGYYAVSCDASDGHCCGGLRIPASDAAKGNVTIPCWIPRGTEMFVKIVTPVPPCSTVSETITQSMTATTVPCVEVATVCKLLSAAFLWIKNSFCFSLQYDVAVRSLTDPSVWTAGYTAVSCDDPSWRCCGGILVSQSDAATGNVTIPCWAPDPKVNLSTL